MPSFPGVQKQYRSLALKLLSIVVLAVLQVVVWNQVYTRAVQLNHKRLQDRQIADLRSRLAAAEQRQREQQELRNQVEVVVPRQNSLPQVIDRLERLSVQQAVALTIADIPEPTAEEEQARQRIPAQPLVVTLQARGPVVALLRYLEMIEHVPELTVVEQWSLSPAATGQAGAAPDTTYLLQVRVVFFLQADDHAT